MRKISFLALAIFVLVSCGGNTDNSTENSTTEGTQEVESTEATQPTTNTQTEESTTESNTESSEDWLCIPGSKAGKITAATSEADLKSIFLEKNVVTDDIEIGGGLLKGTRVYPNTDNEVLVFWQDETTMETPERVVIEKTNSSWETNQGIKIGTTLEELEKMNGGPFKLYGFEWDYAGTITSWEDGSLVEALKIGEKFTVQLGTDKAPGENYGDILGEEEFMSNLPAIRERDLKVVKMGILLN